MLFWRVPHAPNRFGVQSKPAQLQATLASAVPAPRVVINPPAPPEIRPAPPAPELPAVPERVVPKTRPEAAPDAAAQTETQRIEMEPQPALPPIPDRDASLEDEEIDALRAAIAGQGRIRFRFTVTPAGRVEDLIVETTEVPPEIEVAVTRRLFDILFLPAYRGGAAVSTSFTLELEP